LDCDVDKPIDAQPNFGFGPLPYVTFVPFDNDRNGIWISESFNNAIKKTSFNNNNKARSNCVDQYNNVWKANDDNDDEIFA